MEIKDFNSYLNDKKIDAQAFRQAEPKQWEGLKKLYEQVSPSSFTAQKLFLINPIRRKFPLKKVEELKAAEAPSLPKVMMRPKPKTQ
jgi:hypothetical protein